MSILDKRYFRDEAAAFRHLESILWANGVVCPHCGVVDRAGRLKGVKNKSGQIRHGLWKCYACRKQFTVKVGTVFESAHIPLHKMLQAVYLMCSSKKGISAHQLHRTLEVDYKSAWFLAHRIREAMRDGTLAPIGGLGSIVEIDETAQGKLEGHTKGQRWAHMRTVLTLVQRGGVARSFHVDSTSIAELIPIIRANVKAETAVMTDSASWYKFMNRDGIFASHGRVDHTSGEYVRYGSDPLIPPTRSRATTAFSSAA